MERKKLQEEAIECILKNKKARIILTPRLGKTKVVIEVIKKTNLKKILWVTVNRKLIKEDIPSEFIKWGAKKHLKNIEFTTWHSLIKVKGRYDLIILDEEQKITEKNSKNLISGELLGDRIISMTGTKTKDEIKKNIYKNLNLYIKYQIDIKTAVKSQAVSDFEIRIVEIPISNEKILAGNSKRPFKIEEDKNFQYLIRRIENEPDNFYFRIALKKAISFSSNKLKALKLLSNKLKDRKLFFVPFKKISDKITKYQFNGSTSDKYLKKFMGEEINILCLINKGGVGLTYTNVKHVILAQAGRETNGNSSQKIFRALLKQKGIKPIIWILELDIYQDKKWVNSLVNSFDREREKTIRIKFENLKDYI